MENLYFHPGRVAQLSKEQFGVNPLESIFYAAFRATGFSDIENIDKYCDMVGVKPTRSNIEKSLLKCDKPLIYPFDSVQDLVEEMVYQMLKEQLDQTTMTVDDLIEYVARSSPAKDWKERGCVTKGDAVKHPDFLNAVNDIDRAPFVDINGKKELLELLEILLENKIRTTFNPSFCSVMKEKIIWGKQDKALLKSFREIFIKYGLSKQYSGFSDLAKEFERFSLIEESDVSGWDRVVALIGVINVRLKGLKVPEYLKGMLWFVIAYTLTPHIVFPDGVIRIKATGNISGSASTTTNNSIAHLIINVRYIFNIWMEVFGRYPTLKEIYEHHKCAIYSDDNLCGHDLDFFQITKEKLWDIKVATYAIFGMTLKVKQCLQTYKGVGTIVPKEHSFLGSYFYYSNKYDRYIPYPRLNKMCSTLRYCGESRNTIEEEIQKAAALKVLSAPEGWLLKECDNYLKFLLANYKYNENKIPDEYKDILSGKIPDHFWLLYTLGYE